MSRDRQCRGDPLARLGVRRADVRAAPGREVCFVGLSRYLNDAAAAVTHSIDDTTPEVRSCLDALDAHGVKATVFVSTRATPVMVRLWPRLRKAIADGHEVGAHSRRHRCSLRDTALFCLRALSREEVLGPREDILAHTGQSYVWSWAYPCGNCADRRFGQRKLARAGYILARAYPGERAGAHLVPDLQTYDANPLAARYTQVVQRSYVTVDGVPVPGRTDVDAINRKFDDVYAGRGIYSFVSHPQMLEYGPQSFYIQHLAHIGGRADVWYVPMGPLYAYRTLREHTRVVELRPAAARARFAVVTRLDPRVYVGSVTLEFAMGERREILVRGTPLPEAPALVNRWNHEYIRRDAARVWVTLRPNAVVEFR